jgi:hypothetical protein
MRICPPRSPNDDLLSHLFGIFLLDTHCATGIVPFSPMDFDFE